MFSPGARLGEGEGGIPTLTWKVWDLGDLEERILNSRINKEERPFLERDEVIQSIVAEMSRLFVEPSRDGKELSHSTVDEFAESRRCARLQQMNDFDAQQNDLRNLQETKCSTPVSAMVLWHLLQLLDGYGVKLAGQVVKFERMDFANVGEVVERRSRPTGSVNSFEAWVRSACKTKDDVFKQWCLVTAAAFNAQADSPCLVSLDQAELLVKQTLDQQSSLGGSRSSGSRFTQVCSQFPRQMAVHCTGTINMQVDLPAEEYTRLVIKSLPALMPLSFEGAKEAMVQWGGTQYGEEVLDQIYLFSAGVPRLLEYVFQTFQTDGEYVFQTDQLLRSHSMPCPNVLKVPIDLQRLSLIKVPMRGTCCHCRWFFAQQSVGTQPTVSCGSAGFLFCVGKPLVGFVIDGKC